MRMAQYFINYMIVDIFLVLFSVIILSRLNSNIGSEYETTILKRMIYSYIVTLLSDIIWISVKGDIVDTSGFVFRIFNMLYWIALALGCYYWFRFILARLHPTTVYSKAVKFIMTVPLFLIIILEIVRGLTTLEITIEYLYLAVPAVEAARCAVKTHSKVKRSEYLTYSLIILVPFAAGVFDSFVNNTPSAVLSIFVIILTLFLTVQNGQINNDALTDLNNRRRMDKYLEERLADVSVSRPVAVFILDINSFKSINDSFGHVEGDNALKTMARVLKKAADKYGAFVSRYGGDEFCLITSLSKYTPEEIAEGVHQLLSDEQSGGENENKYKMSLCIGYAVCTDPLIKGDDYIKEADKMLYSKKKEWYSKHTAQQSSH
jgi:diguanylate cyclase (GGDEF) domain